MLTYEEYLVSVMKRAYFINHGKAKHLVAGLIKKYVDGMSEDKVIEVFTKFLNNADPIELSTTRNDYKVKYITDQIPIRPTNILDIGAGDGSILYGLKNFYSLSETDVMALDLQKITRTGITVINYDENGSIPLADKSVDLVVMFSLLHHIPPDGRVQLLKEVKRILSPNGYVIIREHNDQRNKKFYIFIQLLHYVWYIHNHESKDPLHMMTIDETKKLFGECGLDPDKFIDLGQNIQQLYCQTFKSRSVIIEPDPRM